MINGNYCPFAVAKKLKKLKYPNFYNYLFFKRIVNPCDNKTGILIDWLGFMPVFIFYTYKRMAPAI